MKRITLKIGLTFVLLVLAGTVYSQTNVPNAVRLVSLNTTSGGTSSTPGTIIAQDDSTISIASTDGTVTVGSDYSLGTLTGKVGAGGARGAGITLRLSAGSVINQTAGVDFGAIDTALNTGGISRNSDGSIGITTDGNASGVDFGEGFTFGFDLTSLPSEYSVEISAVSFSAFTSLESCTVVNRQNTSRTQTFNGTSAGTIIRNISALGILIPGGTVDFDAVSIFNSSSPDAPWRITGIDFKIVKTAASNVIVLTSLTGGTATLPNGTTSTSAAVFFTTDDSNIAIDATGFVTIESDFNRTATQNESGTTFTSANVQIGGARGKTIAIRMSAGNVMNTTDNLGAITTDGAINRASDGGIGVATTAAPTANTGIDNNEGLTFGLDVSSLPSTVAVQVVKVHFSTFGELETCRVVNRQNTTNNETVSGFASVNNGVRDISGLGISIQGGSVGFQEAVSFYNNSPDVQNYRITGIELKIAALSTTWNGTAWSNGNPGPAVDAIIEGNYSALAKGGFSAKTLTVNSGSLTLEATKSVKIENVVTNNAGPSGIIVESGGALVQVINSANANVGAITVNRNSNSLLRLDYTMWSSPVSGTQTLAQFSPLTSQSPNRFYTYDSATDLYANVAPSTIFDVSNAGKGYLIRMPNDASAVTATPFAGVFTGVPNSGPIALNDLTANKFYAVGNPYPSVLNAALFLAGNPNAVGTLYFWRKTNGTANTISGSSTGTAYATWTSLASTASGTVAPNDIAPSANIAVGQGFIVNTGSATSLNFANTMRPNSSTATFLKTKAAASPDRVWLNLTNATGAYSQMAIGYLDTATLGFDNGIDGEYINDSSLALTSNINNKEYTIQGRPTFDASDVVALNFKTAIAGDYTIAIDHFDGLFATGQDIYLADSKTGTETDLKAGPYNFTAAVGVDNSRFTLKYQKTLKVIDSEFNDNSITVYVNNGSLFVKSAVSAIQNIKVFDIQGRLVAEQKNVKSNTTALANLKTNQTLIVQVSTEDNKVVSKKVLN